jgi:hypothetical protein
MRIDRQQVVRLLRERGDPGHADHAAQHLPDSLDLDDDDRLQQLSSYGIQQHDLGSQPQPGTVHPEP